MSTSHPRRAVLAGIATVPALAAPVLAMSGAERDPIFAAIERHRAAAAAFLALLEEQGKLESRLVDERMATACSPEKGSKSWREAIIAAKRDPRYVHAMAAGNENSEAEFEAAWGLVERPAMTLAGAAALTAYALSYKLSNITWPEDEEGSSDDFAAALLRSLCSTLAAGAVS